MQANYRSILDFSGEALEASEKGHSKLMEAVNLLDKIEAVKHLLLMLKIGNRTVIML